VSLSIDMRSSLSKCAVLSFIFTLQEFARELISLVDAMERINLFEQQAASRSWWGWLRSLFPMTLIKNLPNGEKRESSGLKRRICMYSLFFAFLSLTPCLLQLPYLTLTIDVDLISQRFAHMHRTRYKHRHGPS
jgi:hypothetical protein